MGHGAEAEVAAKNDEARKAKGKADAIALAAAEARFATARRLLDELEPLVDALVRVAFAEATLHHPRGQRRPPMMPRTADIETPNASRKRTVTFRNDTATPLLKRAKPTPPKRAAEPKGAHPEVPPRSAKHRMPTIPTPTTPPPAAPKPAAEKQSQKFERPKRPTGTIAESRAEYDQYLRILSRNAKMGDSESLYELRLFMGDYPEIREQIGNLTRTASEEWIKAVSDGEPCKEEAIRYYLMDVQSDLEGKSQSPTVKLLAEVGSLYWLAAHQAERAVAAATAHGNPRCMIAASRVADSAQKRFARMTTTLARLKPLLRREEA